MNTRKSTAATIREPPSATETTPRRAAVVAAILLGLLASQLEVAPPSERRSTGTPRWPRVQPAIDRGKMRRGAAGNAEHGWQA